MKKWLTILMALMAAMWLTAAAAETMYIDGGTADRVHLRVSPSEEASSLGLYFTGTPVERLTTTSGGWSRVRIGSETGYIRTEYLASAATAAFLPCVVDNPTSDWVNLRSGASFQADPVGRLNNGAAVELMGETASGWTYVRTDSGRGYVVSEFIARASGTAASTVTQIVGTTADGGYIHACQPGGGQTVYFVSADAQPLITREDVNFDGYMDLVVTTARGATNCFYEFFVWTGGGYVRAAHPGVDGVANYVLYPEKGFVLSSVNAGNAGALYEDCLFTWDGTDLHLLRRATAECLREYRSEGSAFVTVLYDRKIDLTVYAYTADGSMTLIHSEIIDLNGFTSEKLDEMKQRLWQGLR